MNNEPSNESKLTPEPVTDLPSFLRRYQQQLIGFVGWFVLSAIIWIPLSKSVDGILLNLFVFPLTIIALIVLGLIKRTRNLALGILLALAVNFVLSLVLGLFYNGICFFPFYIDLNL